MRYNVTVSGSVWQEIEDITTYIKEQSDIDKSDDFYNLFDHVLEEVEDNPEIGRLSDRTSDRRIHQYLMPRPFQKYIIKWQIVNDEEVQVFQIRHTARLQIDFPFSH